jgi:hypothetical protein
MSEAEKESEGIGRGSGDGSGLVCGTIEAMCDLRGIVSIDPLVRRSFRLKLSVYAGTTCAAGIPLGVFEKS